VVENKEYNRWPIGKLARACAERGLRPEIPLDREKLIARLQAAVTATEVRPVPSDPAERWRPGERASASKQVRRRLAGLDKLPLCLCGCGLRVRQSKHRFIAGHSRHFYEQLAGYLDGDLQECMVPESVIDRARGLFPGDRLEAEIRRPKEDGYTKAVKQEIQARKKAGASTFEIAAEYGLSHKTMLNISGGSHLTKGTDE
jgi:hypothetical protein